MKERRRLLLPFLKNFYFVSNLWSLIIVVANVSCSGRKQGNFKAFFFLPGVRRWAFVNEHALLLLHHGTRIQSMMMHGISNQPLARDLVRVKVKIHKLYIASSVISWIEAGADPRGGLVGLQPP